MKLKEGVIRNERLLDSDVVLGFDEKRGISCPRGLGRIKKRTVENA